LFIVALALVIAFAVIWIATVVGLFLSFPYLSYFSPDQHFLSTLGVFNILFIVGLILFNVISFFTRLISGTRVPAKWRTGIGIFWFLNLFSLAFVAVHFIRDFGSEAEVVEKIDAGFDGSDTLRLQVAGGNYHSQLLNIADELYLTEEELTSVNVRLAVEKTDGETFELTRKAISRGKTQEEARLLAERAVYHIGQEQGQTLVFSPSFSIKKGGKWRNQQIELLLRVPAGKFLIMDKSITWILHDVEVDERGVTPWSYPGNIWKMGEDGLICMNCKKEGQDEEKLSFKDFSRIKVDGDLKVVVEQGGEFDLRLLGKEHYIEQVDVAMFDQTLTISSRLDDPSSPVRAHVVMPRLVSFEADATDDIRIRGFKQERMELTGKGNHEIKALLEVDSLIVNLDERGKMDLRGKYSYMKAQVQKRARLDAEKAQIREADISAREGSRIKLGVVEKITPQKDDDSRIDVRKE
jgi:hypothetical protein